MSWLSRLLAASLAVAMCLPSIVRSASPGDASVTALGPERGWISSIAISPGFDVDGRMWAAPFGGRVYATSNGGRIWRPSAAGETDPVVAALAVSPNYASDHTVFAAADDGVFRSSDSGTTWLRVGTGLHGRYCHSLAVSPSFAADRTLFVGTDQGVYRSSDGGTTWNAPLDHTGAILSLAVVPSAGGLDVLAGPSAGGLLRSADGGQTWSAVDSFPADRIALTIAAPPGFSPGGPIFVGTDQGVLTGSSGLSDWSSSLQKDRIPAIAVSPDFARDRAVFAGSTSGDGVSVSYDAGSSWSRAGGSDGFVDSLAVSPQFATDRTVVAGSAGRGISISRDAGATWTSMDSGLLASEVAQIALDGGSLLMAGNGGASVMGLPLGAWHDLPLPSRFETAVDAQAGNLFVGTQDQGLQISYDGGATWARAGFTDSAVSAVGLSPLYLEDRTALVAAGFVYRTIDGGHTWTASSGLGGDDVRRIRFSPSFGRDHTVFAATVNHRVLVSRDGGAAWTQSSEGLPIAQINDLLPSETYALDHTVYAATGGNGLYVSSDSGSSWQPAANQPPVANVVSLLWGPNGALLAGTDRGLFRDFQNAWTRVGGTWDEFVTELEIAGSTLYAGTLGDGVWSIALSEPTATPVPDVGNTPKPAPPRPSSTPTAVPTRTAARPTLHPHLRVFPNPLSSGMPTVVQIQGPPSGTVRVTLSSRGWSRTFLGALSRDGWAAFGFVAPAATLLVRARVAGKGLAATITLTVPVARHAWEGWV